MAITMRLPTDTIIAESKLKFYLLTWRASDDKSVWLAKAGYSLENWQDLEQDLRHLISSHDAKLFETTRFGKMYEIKTVLSGPNGKSLRIRSYWMTESATGLTKFITMFPDKEA